MANASSLLRAGAAAWATNTLQRQYGKHHALQKKANQVKPVRCGLNYGCSPMRELLVYRMQGNPHCFPLFPQRDQKLRIIHSQRSNLSSAWCALPMTNLSSLSMSPV